MSFYISGTGSAAPFMTVTNNDLSKLVDTNDEWILSRTGIKERRVLSTESLADISLKAAEAALINAGLTADNIDLIIFSTVCGDSYTPSMACVMAGRLNARCPAFDINAACSGFIYALEAAAGFYSRGKVKNVLIVCAEAMSRHLDWTDRASCVLFGDGAGAVVLSAGDGYMGARLTAAGNEEILDIPFTGGGSPFYKRGQKAPYLKLNGQEVYKFAVLSAPADIKHVLNEAGLEIKDITYLLLHQANVRIIDAVRQKLGIDKDRCLTMIERYGNVSSACIPMLLDENNRKGMFKKGDILMLSAFGGGLTTAACIIRW